MSEEIDHKYIFCNGVFDIFHIGHLRLLQYASSFGPVLVAVNSDASVKRLKGNSRPINCLEYRLEILRSLRCVNRVVSFDEDTPYELIKRIRPLLIIKGGDYSPEQVVGIDLAEVKIFPHLAGISSTLLSAPYSGEFRMRALEQLTAQAQELDMGYGWVQKCFNFQ